MACESVNKSRELCDLWWAWQNDFIKPCLRSMELCINKISTPPLSRSLAQILLSRWCWWWWRWYKMFDAKFLLPIIKFRASFYDRLYFWLHRLLQYNQRIYSQSERATHSQLIKSFVSFFARSSRYRCATTAYLLPQSREEKTEKKRRKNTSVF